MQLPLSERYAFIMDEIVAVRMAYEDKHGRHPKMHELDRNLRAWARVRTEIHKARANRRVRSMTEAA